MLADRDLDRALLRALGYRVETRECYGLDLYVLLLPSGEYAPGCADDRGWSTEDAAWATLPGLDTWAGMGLVIEAMRSEKRIDCCLQTSGEHCWWAAFGQGKDVLGVAEIGSAPLAVRLAALRALGVAVDG